MAASDAYLRATVTEREKIVGQDIFDVYPDGQADRAETGVHDLKASLQRVLQNRAADKMAVRKYDIRRTQPGGGKLEERYWSPVNLPVFGQRQRVEYIVHHVADVTELVQLQERAREQRQFAGELRLSVQQMKAESRRRALEFDDVTQRLQAANDEVARLYAKGQQLERLKSEFFAQAEKAMNLAERFSASAQAAVVLAHEINNPIMAVSNLLYILRGDSSLDEATQELLQLAEQELRRIGQITQQALGLSRARGRSEPVRICRVIDDLLQFYAKNIQRAQLTVTRRYDCEAELLLDAGAIRQVLTNLLLNAMDALPEAGTLKLHVYQCRDWRDGSRQFVRIVVADNGAGIAPENRDKLFQPFFTTKGAQGTGLGLWVTRAIIDKMGGMLRCRTSTRPGRRGTCFVVILPSEGVTRASRVAPRRGRDAR